MIIETAASSANLGPGFDSIGMAVSLFLRVEDLGPSSNWHVEHDMPFVSHDENNMIVQAALRTDPNMRPHHLRVKSEIPLARGLGSSSSAIAAGIELANQDGELKLSEKKKIEIGSNLEGHPDNITPVFLGGLVVGVSIHSHVDAVKLPLFPYSLLAYVPSYQLATQKARSALPGKLTFATAVRASAIANVLVASLATRNYRQAFALMQEDVFHEPYREKLVPELTKIKKIGRASGALATYLSGAGSTVMTIIRPENSANFIEQLRQAGLKDEILRLHPVDKGVKVID